MKRHFLTAFLAVGAVLLTVSGCGKKKDPVVTVVESTAPQVASTGLSVGISFPDETDPRWKKDGDALTSEFRAKGIDVNLAYAGNAASKQASDLGAMVSSGVDLIIVASVDGSGLSGVLSQAKEAGIPVVAYDRLVMNTDAITAYITFSDYEAGCLEAKYIAQSLGLKEDGSKKEYGIEYAACKIGDEPVGYVFNGAFDVLKPYFDTDGLRSISGENTLHDALTTAEPQPVTESVPDPAKAEADAVINAEASVMTAAKKRLQSIFSTCYGGENELAVVLCTDPLSARAAEEAVSASKLKNDVIITACGVDDALLAEIVDGRIAMTVFEPTDEIRSVLLSLSVSLLKGESPDETLIERSGWSFECVYDTGSYENGSTVVPAYLISPVTVTASTIDAELVRTGYCTMDGKYPKLA